MKLKKRALALAVSLVMMFAAVFMASGSAFAASGDIAGKIYSTDIIALINGSEVPSYNIGGRTVVVIEDLCDLYVGIRADYDDSRRLLTVYGENTVKKDTHAERGKVGKVLGNVYETDIKVLFNGSYVTGYNIGGKTAVCLEDVGNIYEGPNVGYGYSKYAARAVWNEADRIISLDFAGESPLDMPLAGDVARYVFYFKDNVMTADYDEMNIYRSYFGTTESFTLYTTPEFAKEVCVIKPLYVKYGDTTEEAGICYAAGNNKTLARFNDAAALAAKLNAYGQSQKGSYTYDEIMAKFDDGVNFKLIDKLEAEDYVFLASEDLNTENAVKYVSVSKAGDFAVLYASQRYEQMKLEKTGVNQVTVSVYPFAGPRGTVWAGVTFDLPFTY
ncbi:MAG: hypothetical protein IKD89_06910 [Clostridia bacterium]|nr:hypothetical protein [Clostridia bacterium]